MLFFGAYDGHVSFYEPMITRAYLESRPDLCVPIKQPQAWQIEALSDHLLHPYLAEDEIHRVARGIRPSARVRLARPLTAPL